MKFSVFKKCFPAARLRFVIVFCLAYTFLCAQDYQLHRKIQLGNSALKTIVKNTGVPGTLIIGNENGMIYFQKQTSDKWDSLRIHSAAVNSIGFNSNGNLMLSSTRDGEIKIYDFDKQKVIQGLYSPSFQNVNFSLFSIADGFIYFNSNNKLYKTRSDLSQEAREVYTFEEHLMAAVITPDRNSLLLCSGNKLFVLNTRTDLMRQELSTGNSGIEQMTLQGDSVLVTWSQDGTINYWKYKWRQLEGQPYFGFKAGNPAPLVFSADGKMLLTGKIGTWARVWRPLEKQVAQELFGHSGTVQGGYIERDETEIYTIGNDGLLLEWKKGPAPADKPNEVNPALPALLVSNTELHKTDSVSVSLTPDNIPEIIQGRKVIRTENIQINRSELTVYVYDNSYIDGDTMSLFFNGEWILDHYGVTKQKKAITLKFRENTNNYLVLFANNLGKSPPNTAAILFNDGQRDRLIRLSSDLSSCSAINFIYQPGD